MPLKMVALIPETWLAEALLATEVILIVKETEVILVEQVKGQVPEMHKQVSLVVEDNRPQLQLIEIAQEEMLQKQQAQQEEEPVEPILQVLQTETDLNIAIRNIRIVKEIHRKLDILVQLMGIQVVQHSQIETLPQDNRVIKDPHLLKVAGRIDQIIKDQVVLKAKADNIVSQHRPTLVRQVQTEVLVLPIDPILHPQDQILLVLIQHQAEAIIATLQVGVVEQEALVAV